MNMLEPLTSAVKSCSKECSMTLAYLLVFMILPIDSLVGVNLQVRIKTTLSGLLNNNIGRTVAALLFLTIWTTNDIMLLLLYSCLLNKLDLF